MKKIYKISTVLILFLIMLVPIQPAQARGLLDGKVIFGDDFTLESGQTLGGDLVVFGGDVTIEKDATVEGSVVVFGGLITQNGEVTSDIVIFGGQIDLGEKALVQGDIITIGGQINQAAGAVIEGDVIENVPAPSVELPKSPGQEEGPRTPTIPSNPPVEIHFNPFTQAMQVFGNALVLATLAMILTLFLRPQIERVGQTIVAQPLVSGSIGLLTVVLAPFVILILVITILLIPVAVLSVLLLMLIWLFGMIAIGQVIGERLAESIHQTWTPVVSIGLGTFLLMIVGGSIGLVPCVGWLVPLLIGFMAIGGVLMTWFRLRSGSNGGILPSTEPIPPAA